ncbi:ATP synthase F1 subunit delta [Paraliomyxa miuraensis]|uniref:ATP synthase F1 subunit delta n=1 Tax=Paraliomyxa miuraensis TaxID=376150 RepID=UPI00225A1DC5|nr:ATP synthase F1 subunit delta [Paraliomyxa miuraensis]MCX4239568.1 ATP synthase F1 subunit delta [Paraliomyxa miuraensis]
MIPGSLARRYARALIGLADSAAQRDKLAKDLDAFADVCRSQDSYGMVVLTVLSSDRYSLADRKKLVDSFLRRLSPGGADPILGKFLHYVLDRGRMEGVPDIARAYRRMADEAAGRVNAEITSAAPLTPDAVSKITAALERATGKKVIATTAVDPELIGGVIAKVGSTVVDGSVRSALGQLRSSLRG